MGCLILWANLWVLHVTIWSNHRSTFHGGIDHIIDPNVDVRLPFLWFLLLWFLLSPDTEHTVLYSEYVGEQVENEIDLKPRPFQHNIDLVYIEIWEGQGTRPYILKTLHLIKIVVTVDLWMNITRPTCYKHQFSIISDSQHCLRVLTICWFSAIVYQLIEFCLRWRSHIKHSLPVWSFELFFLEMRNHWIALK